MPTLANDPTYKQAVGALGGDGVSGYVALPAVFRLADSLGAVADPGYQQATPVPGAAQLPVFGSGEQGDFRPAR